MTDPASAASQAPRLKRITEWIAELFRFGTVGLLAFIVDTGLMNLLRFGPGGLLEDKPLTAKAISVSVAVLVAWLGNRYWAFASKRSAETPAARSKELVQFVVVNLIGMAIALACLAISHYLLEFTSPLADNISANGVGLVLGTAFRYTAYRYWVFTGNTGLPPADELSPPPAAAHHNERSGR